LVTIQFPGAYIALGHRSVEVGMIATDASRLGDLRITVKRITSLAQR
jgi:hypothetical protein